MTKSSDQQKENWYAAYTRPRSEKKVYELLTQYNFDSYLPLVTTIRQWSDRKKKVQLPLISSYVFVKTEEGNLKNILPINGVVRILKHLGKPAIIRDYEIDNLKILLSDTGKITFIENINLKKGDSIIVEKGVFKGLIAECIKLNGKHRVIVRIEGIENIIEVNIPLSHIKKTNTI
jgi:transcription antitermination factor NusG